MSIVQHRYQRGMLLVRARFEGDIERVFPGAQVAVTPDADYLYRASVLASHVGEVIADQLVDIDYDNFKNSVSEDWRHDLYLGAWSHMKGAQDAEKEAVEQDTPVAEDAKGDPFANW